MSEIKFDHFKNIEELIQHLEMWYVEDDYFAYDRYFHLDDARKMGMYIYKQHQEIERLNNIIKEIRKQLDYLETYSSKEDVFEDMKRRLDRIDKIIGSDKE